MHVPALSGQPVLPAYWWEGKVYNFGDRLTAPILNALGYTAELVAGSTTGKLVGIGSTMRLVKPGDAVWGTGNHRPEKTFHTPDVTYLAVRGPLTAKAISGSPVPKVYGDPALLLPVVYSPPAAIDRRPQYKVGYLPHFVDYRAAKIRTRGTGNLVIDVTRPWRETVDAVLSCERIVATCLHGIVCAEAYGVPVTWELSYTKRVIGGPHKFQDYFLGTDRGRQKPGRPVEPLDRVHASEIRSRLATALHDWTGQG